MDYQRDAHGFRSPERVTKLGSDEGEKLAVEMVACLNELDEKGGDFRDLGRLAEKWDSKMTLCGVCEIPSVLPVIVRVFSRCANVAVMRLLAGMVVQLSTEDAGLLRLMGSRDDANFIACLCKAIDATQDVELLAGFVSIVGNFFAITTREDADALAATCNIKQFFDVSDTIEFNTTTQKFFQKFMKSMFQFCAGDYVDAESAQCVSCKASQVIAKCGADYQCARMYCWIHVKLLERDMLSAEQASQLNFAGIMSPEIREDGVVTLVLGRILQKFHDQVAIDITIDEILANAVDFHDEQSGPVALWVAQMIADHESAAAFIRMGERFAAAYEASSVDFKTELVALLWVLVMRAPDSAQWFFQEFTLMEKTLDVLSSAPADAVRQICELIRASVPHLNESIVAEIQAQNDALCESIAAHSELDGLFCN